MSKAKLPRQSDKVRRIAQSAGPALRNVEPNAGTQAATLARMVARAARLHGTEAPQTERLARLLERSAGRVHAARALDEPSRRLAVTEPEDASEKEAESVARQVAGGEPAHGANTQRAHRAAARPATPDETLARLDDKSTPAARAIEKETAAPTGTEDQAARQMEQSAPDQIDTETAADRIAQSGPGGPLEPDIRQKLETHFGRDLSAVRVHTDAAADEAAAALQARAFAKGQDIYLRASESAGDLTLMSHEVTHVVQQTEEAMPAVRRATGGAGPAPTQANPVPRQAADDETVARQPAAPEAAAGDTAPGVIDLKGQSELAASQQMIDYVAARPRRRGKARLRFGDLAEGDAEVEKRGERLQLAKRAALDFRKPLFPGLPMPAEFSPHLLVQQGSEGQIRGFVGIGPSGQFQDLLQLAQSRPELVGLAGLDLDKLERKATNRLDGGKLELGLNDVGITIGGAFRGTITLTAVDGGAPSFTGAATVNVKGLAEGELNLDRTPDGVLSGTAKVTLNLPRNITGTVTVNWVGGTEPKVHGEGKVGYRGEKLSGEVTLQVMEAAEAQRLKRQKQAPEESESRPQPAGARRSKKTDYAVFGEGDLTFSFTEWLSGQAHVIVDPVGHVTVIGKIEPQAEITLLEQRDFIKPLPKLEARAAYGLPVVGNIFIFANIGLDAFAKLGPAKLYKIAVEGTYSTDPEQANDFRIRGSLNISAAAGLRLRGEAGAGLEILAHDIKAGAGINGIAGVQGYAEATPVIGYRESKGGEPTDKKGQFFISGELDIAGQAFLGLSGDLFVEVDAPWWSPVPDKKWTWPLGGKQWPIGSPIGLKANVDYVFGSNEWPKIDVQPPQFDSSKFLTDLYQDKAPPAKKEEEKPGSWKEKNSPDAAPPKPGKGGTSEGELPASPDAQPPVAPGSTRPSQQQVDPNARTAEGKSVRELQDEAAAKTGVGQDGSSPLVPYKLERPFSMRGQNHALKVRIGEAGPNVWMESNPLELRSALQDAIGQVSRSTRSADDKSYYIGVLTLWLESVRAIDNEVELFENEIKRGIRTGPAAERKAIDEYVERRLASLTNSMREFAQASGIKSLEDFYRAPPEKRFLPAMPGYRSIGDYIRRRLYDGLGWDRVRAQVEAQERQRLLDDVRLAQAERNVAAWTRLIREGLVETNADIASYNPESVVYGVDHEEPLALRWNRAGKNTDDAERYDQMSERSNLRYVTREYNSRKGSDDERYEKYVGLEFTSENARSGMLGSGMIDGRRFVDASGNPIP